MNGEIWNMRNSFHSIPSHSIPLFFSNPNNETLFYSIPLRFIPLYSINPNRALKGHANCSGLGLELAQSILCSTQGAQSSCSTYRARSSSPTVFELHARICCTVEIPTCS
ncbi:hypothetical protein QL285_004371 [Trifolium repens]|jgi:hypothetical protein|nr:hypothetical protein QL285_004371 [Trifolium repens]